MPATIFDKPIFPGARIVTVEVEVSNVSGSYTNTVQDNRISASMEANSIEIDDPSVFRDKITVTSYNGSFVVSCPSVEGETTARISFLKIMDDQQVISSHEYDELNNNIGDLEDLETTDQSSIVNAVNEVIDNKPDYATEMPMSDSDSTSVSQAIANITDSLLPQKANKFVRFNEVLYHNASTTLAYTGISVTIPKNCDFAISGFGIYNNTPPQEIAISSSSNSGQTYNFIAYGAISSGISSVSAIGYTDNNPITLYLHMKRAGASGNQDGLKGWYIPRD